MKPVISICIPNYNHGRVLEQTLDSVILNITPEIEVLISDNASTDNSQTIIEKYRKHKNVQLFYQKDTIPMSQHWNYVGRKAKGEWVIILSSDDVLEPNTIEKLLAAISNTKAKAIFFEYDFLENGIKKAKTPFYDHTAEIFGIEQFKVFLKGNNFPLSACMFKRELMDRVDWFNDELVFCTDWHAWLKLCEASKHIVYIKEPLLLYRYHQDNETHRCVENLTALDEVILMKNELIKKHNIQDTTILKDISKNNLKLAKNYLERVTLRNLLDAQRYYENKVAELTVILEKYNTNNPPNHYFSAPYPLPFGSIKFSLDNSEKI